MSKRHSRRGKKGELQLNGNKNQTMFGCLQIFCEIFWHCTASAIQWNMSDFFFSFVEDMCLLETTEETFSLGQSFSKEAHSLCVVEGTQPLCNTWLVWEEWALRRQGWERVALFLFLSFIIFFRVFSPVTLLLQIPPHKVQNSLSHAHKLSEDTGQNHTVLHHRLFLLGIYSSLQNTQHLRRALLITHRCSPRIHIPFSSGARSFPASAFCFLWILSNEHSWKPVTWYCLIILCALLQLTKPGAIW